MSTNWMQGKGNRNPMHRKCFTSNVSLCILLLMCLGNKLTGNDGVGVGLLEDKAINLSLKHMVAWGDI